MALGLLFAIPGICLAVAAKEPSLPSKLLIALVTELGFAFIIAWVIISTVDEREKKEHALKVEKDERRLSAKLYLNTVLDVDLPGVVGEESQSYIAGADFLKEHQNVFFSLKRCGNFVRMEQVFETIYTNVSNVTQSWAPTFDSYDNRVEQVEKEHSELGWGIQNLEVTLRRADGRPDENVETTPTEKLKDSNSMMLSKALELQPGDQVEMKITQIASKYASDNELFTNKALTKEMYLEVNYDKSEFDVLYRSIHPRENFAALERKFDSDRIIFEHPFLPSHGFIVWWRLKNDQEGLVERRSVLK